MKETAHKTGMPPIRNLIGFSSLIIVIFCLVVVYHGSRGYRETIEQSKENATRLAHSLADHVELTFLGADLSLRRAIERQYFNALFGNNLLQYTEQSFKLWIDETPQIAAMALIDADGIVRAAAHKSSYDHWMDYTKILNNEQFFKTMRDADDSYVFIGRYTMQNKAPLILIGRRYSRLDGEFGGVIIAAISPTYFIDFYRSVASGNSPFMSLTLQDGTVLVSSLSHSDANNALVSRIVTEQPQQKDHRITASVTDDHGVTKTVASKSLNFLNVAVSVVLEEEDILADWRQMRAKDIGFLVLFTVFGSVLSFFAIAMARHIMRAEESENAAILASQAKSEFLANMSHELRTPLNAIIGFSEMINSGYFGPLTEKQRERINDINLCGTHLLQLINDILEFSKGDAGKLELVEEKVDMAEIIHECSRIMSGKIRSKQISLITDITPGLPAIWGDKRKIRQVLLNLLSNSVKFTPEKGAIRVIARMDQQNGMQLMVSDSGIGISEEDIPKALSVFGQVHRSQSHEGTGLGLPLCKMYAELHGGKLTLTSKVGEGTTVRISLPPQRTLAQK